LARPTRPIRIMPSLFHVPPLILGVSQTTCFWGITTKSGGKNLFGVRVIRRFGSVDVGSTLTRLEFEKNAGWTSNSARGSRDRRSWRHLAVNERSRLGAKSLTLSAPRSIIHLGTSAG
jgi:hypothetical protein